MVTAPSVGGRTTPQPFTKSVSSSPRAAPRRWAGRAPCGRQVPTSRGPRACAGWRRGRHESGARARRARRSRCRRTAPRRRRPRRPRRRSRARRPGAARSGRGGVRRRRPPRSPRRCRPPRRRRHARSRPARAPARCGPACPTLGERAPAARRRLATGDLAEVVERRARDPERDRGDRDRQRPEHRERIQRPRVGRTVRQQRRAAPHRDLDGGHLHVVAPGGAQAGHVPRVVDPHVGGREQQEADVRLAARERADAVVLLDQAAAHEPVAVSHPEANAQRPLAR